MHAIPSSKVLPAPEHYLNLDNIDKELEKYVLKKVFG